MRECSYFLILCGVAAAAFGAAASLSFAAGMVAVVLPQILMLEASLAKSQLRQLQKRRAFSLWAGKFSVTVLLLACGARGLSEVALFAPEFFVSGAILGLVWNVVKIIRFDFEAKLAAGSDSMSINTISDSDTASASVSATGRGGRN